MLLRIMISKLSLIIYIVIIRIIITKLSLIIDIVIIRIMITELSLIIYIVINRITITKLSLIIYIVIIRIIIKLFWKFYRPNTVLAIRMLMAKEKTPMRWPVSCSWPALSPARNCNEDDLQQRQFSTAGSNDTLSPTREINIKYRSFKQWFIV